MATKYTEMVDDLRKVYATGKTKDLAWRRHQLEQIHKMVQENHEQITAAVCADLGGHKLRGLAEITVGASADHALDNLADWAEEKTVAGVVHKQCVRPEPRGIVLIIAPWNFPFVLLLHPAVGAIAAGNCVVLKPSELTPNSAEVIEQLVTKYLDNDCIKVATGGSDVCTGLLEQRWDHICYTGGPRHAPTIAACAAKSLTPVTLELGGKSPVIIDKSAQIDAAVDRISVIKWMNCGQICMAPDYILCHESRADEFEKRMLAAVKAAYGANPQESPDYGKIVNAAGCDRLQKLIETSGGEVLCGGASEVDREARFVPPTIIKGPPLDAPIMNEEIFGPVLPIVTFKTMDEAKQIVNSKETPLAMYIFSEDGCTVEKTLMDIESGGSCVNTVMEQAFGELLPFGGKGPSGCGKYHGKFGFEEFSHLRAVVRKSTWPGFRAPVIPLPKSGQPVPDIVYPIATKLALGITPRPVKRLLRRRQLQKAVKVALAAAVVWTFGPQIRQFMELVGA